MESYDIIYQNAKIVFIPSEDAAPADQSIAGVNRALLKDKWISFARLGDPAVISCAVYRKKGSPGGVFVMETQEEPLFIAKTGSNLVFSLACGRFSGLVEQARYAADIWEDAVDNED